MFETILNIYLIIDKGFVTAFRAKAYQHDGSDKSKFEFLKDHAKGDFESAYRFDAPQNKKGKFMAYRKFSKLESRGMQYMLFEEIFEKFDVPQNPVICVTPVVDGEVWSK